MESVIARFAEVVLALLTVDCRQVLCTLSTVDHQDFIRAVDGRHLALQNGSFNEQEGLTIELVLKVHAESFVHCVHQFVVLMRPRVHS